jgi:hypothetical protein
VAVTGISPFAVMAISALRGALSVLSSTETVMVASPSPEVGSIVIQDAPAPTLIVHSTLHSMSKDPVPPAAVKLVRPKKSTTISAGFLSLSLHATVPKTIMMAIAAEVNVLFILV